MLLLGLFLLWLLGRNPAPEPAAAEAVVPVEPVIATPPTATTRVAEMPDTAPKTVAAATPAGDDLTRIEGIGPKTAEALRGAGITTFAELAATPEEQLRRILVAASLPGDPGTWPQQAALAAAGKWGELEAYQARLKGGRPE